ncbi:MAG: LysM peptidoglycan-binding domain-containing protein [Flavobacteriales bacterium]|nr:LysM peptidoglycan-binding domain-containing protein [Flavobacteriales bacterium]
MQFLFRHLWLALPFVAQSAVAQPDDAVRLTADDPVVQRLDDLAQLPWIKHSTFTTDTAHHNVHGYPAEHIPAWSATAVSERLRVLDDRTPFDLTYNAPVQAYIDLYTIRKRELSSRMLGLAELYFPVFEEALDRHRMPMELKYLAVVESALNPAARSRAGAVGLWQFMLPTGKMYGLDVDSYIDERHDVYLSTDAACKYLKYLHSLYDSWEMALAAYNCGPGNVNKAIRRSGGYKDYWKIYDHLPRETRGYVPAFIAVNYLFAHHADHNLYPVAPTYCAYEVDTLQVCYRLDLQSVAKLTGASYEELQALNPTFKLGVVPDIAQPMTIYMPREAAGVFVANEDHFRYAVPAQATPLPASTATVAAAAPTAAQRTHTVRSGESLGTIARKYGVSVSDLKRWNGLRSDRIHAGQKLKVGRPQGSTSAERPAPDRAAENFAYYTVQPGDTLWNIAQRHPGVTVEDLRRLNADGLRDGLKPGLKLKVTQPRS